MGKSNRTKVCAARLT